MLKREKEEKKKKNKFDTIAQRFFFRKLVVVVVVPWLAGSLRSSARDTRESLAPPLPSPPLGHVIHIEHATGSAYVCLLYHGSLTWLISLLVQP